MWNMGLIIFIIISGCVGAQPLNNNSLTQENLRNQLKREDFLRVKYKEGKVEFLVIDAIEETYLLGHNKKKNNIEIPYSLIDELKIYQPDTGKTIVISTIAALLIVSMILLTSN